MSKLKKSAVNNFQVLNRYLLVTYLLTVFAVIVIHTHQP